MCVTKRLDCVDANMCPCQMVADVLAAWLNDEWVASAKYMPTALANVSAGRYSFADRGVVLRGRALADYGKAVRCAAGSLARTTQHMRDVFLGGRRVRSMTRTRPYTGDMPAVVAVALLRTQAIEDQLCGRQMSMRKLWWPAYTPPDVPRVVDMRAGCVIGMWGLAGLYCAHVVTDPRELRIAPHSPFKMWEWSKWNVRVEAAVIAGVVYTGHVSWGHEDRTGTVVGRKGATNIPDECGYGATTSLVVRMRLKMDWRVVPSVGSRVEFVAWHAACLQAGSWEDAADGSLTYTGLLVTPQLVRQTFGHRTAYQDRVTGTEAYHEHCLASTFVFDEDELM